MDVEAVCLFGSVARGDFDTYSDIDLLIVINDCCEEELILIKEQIASELDMPYHWLSVYRRSSLKDLFNYGSYFLWHVKTEGKVLYSRSGFLERILKELPPYTKTKDNLLEYLAVCRDIRSSIIQDSLTYMYELAVLASIARNTCIALSFLFGKLEFGRYSCVIVCREILGEQFPFSINEYSQLYNYRLQDRRGHKDSEINHKLITRKYIEDWVNKIERLIGIALLNC